VLEKYKDWTGNNRGKKYVPESKDMERGNDTIQHMLSNHNDLNLNDSKKSLKDDAKMFRNLTGHVQGEKTN